MEGNDLQACVEITRVNWDDNEARKSRDQFIQLQNAKYFVALENAKIVGWAGIMPSPIKEGVWELIWVNVHPDYRNRGIGEDLTNLRISEAKRGDAKVLHLVTNQTKFFAKFGFSVTLPYPGGKWFLMTRFLGRFE